jgi:hypothetical protein
MYDGKLDELKANQLRNLYLMYFPDSNPGKMSKRAMIEDLEKEFRQLRLQTQNIWPVGVTEKVPRSVRIQRIYDAMKDENNG